MEVRNEADILECQWVPFRIGQGFHDYFEQLDADFFCPGNQDAGGAGRFFSEGYHYISPAQRKGYSGTAVFARKEPINLQHGLFDRHLDEGRVITMEYPDFYLVNCYVPNAQPELKRIDYRMEFEDDMRAHLVALDKEKPVIYCGDLNVAHNEIDLRHPKPNRGNAGFSDQERGKMTELLAAGLPIRSATCTPIKPMHIPGGRI